MDRRLAPIVEAIRGESTEASVLQVDEKLIDYPSPGHWRARTGYLWVDSADRDQAESNWQSLSGDAGLDAFLPGQTEQADLRARCVAAFLRQMPGEPPESRRSRIITALDEHCRDLGFERTDNFLSHFAHHLAPTSDPIACRARDWKVDAQAV